MKNININEIDGLVELNKNEAATIDGGESLWYWVGYGVGAFVAGMVSAREEYKNDPRYLDAAMMY